MEGQITADAGKLLTFDDGLKQTPAQIDFVMSENDDIISDTKNQILELLEDYKSRQEQAYEKLVSAQAALLQAQSMAGSDEDFDVPYYLLQEAATAQADYDEISSVCALIERIYDDFLMAVAAYSGKMSSLRQEYISVLQQSSYILTQYAELVKKSSAITSGSPGGASSNGTGVFFGGAITPSSGSANVVQGNNQQITDNLYEISTTKQTWTVNPDGSMVFNTPVDTGEKLDSNQGKVSGFLGTCGLVSCVNVLRLAGYPATESEVVTYASSTSAGFGLGKLCTINSFPENNGGTSAKNRQQILQHFGIRSELREATIENISDAVSEGRGVIISVYAGMLYNGWTNHQDLHAITVTSVKKDKAGNILGFYVCDSGTGGIDNSKYYTAFQLENALSGRKMNVTSVIR